MQDCRFEKCYAESGIAVRGKPAYSFAKRCFDIAVSLLILILFFWLFLIIIVAIKLDDGGKAIYVSERVGKHGKIFKFYKFRSMCINADKMVDKLDSSNETDGNLFKIKNDPRITRVGKFLRRASLDELPQIINVLKGDMSLVGPRPPLVREVENYAQLDYIRLAVVGGLTCYWQVKGRSSINFDGMVELDKKYIEERSVLTDIKILFLTIPAVLKGDGAY